ncbi:hypothetical protein L596_001152 [Steinernema carpocapsae]|uniref:Uncharacterized protein n=1 Tax=Steinernema carpocapsae TaxID=34508 RepID=A0A4U8UPG5_STECR|nr:hypothetical protein L596_001152 [Steinernema carpocapsae]
MHILILISWDIDEKWIQEFSSWKKLCFLRIEVMCEENVETLVRKLLDLGRILHLSFSFCEKAEIKLGSEFLLQDQFLSLRYDTFNQESVEQMSSFTKAEELTGKTLKWKGYVRLHNDTFEKVDQTDQWTRRYESKKRVVEYFNQTGNLQMSDEEFMKEVTLTAELFT